LTERRLLLATTNPGKIREMRALFKGLPWKIVGLEDVCPGQAFRETGRTFVENAQGKSLFFSRTWDGLTLAEDSGLEVEALDGAPGVISARFARPRPTDDRNNDKVLRRLAGVPEKRRAARFVCVMALSRQGRLIKMVRGEVRGRIVMEPRGSGGFGYDPLFYYPRLRKTFAELPPEVKNRVSHRGRAVRKMRAFLEKDRQGRPL
jgi:XTP/dITP diphosphohydrolase